MARTTSIMATLKLGLDVLRNEDIIEVSEGELDRAYEWLDEVAALAHDFDEVLKPANESG